MKNFYLLFLLLFISSSSLEAQNYKYGKVSKQEVEEKAHSLDPEADAAVLFRKERIYYSFDTKLGFMLTTEIHERIKIYNKNGFDWATKEIQLYKSGSDEEKVNGIRGETYYIENGKLVSQKLEKEGVFQEESNKFRNKTKLTMPSISEGCVIEYRYTKESPFLYSIDEIELQYTIPINKLEVSVKVPEYFVYKRHTNPKSSLNFKIEESGKSTAHSSSRIEGGREALVSGYKASVKHSKLEYMENVYTIEKDNIPALKDEEYVDYLKNYAASLNMELLYTKFPSRPLENYSESWENVTKKIYQHQKFGKELQQIKYFKEDLDNLLGGVVTPEDKINTIFQFIKSKVKWNDYVGYYTDNGVKEAYKDGSGNIADINLMLTAMLNYAGLNANPILLSTKNNGIPIYPTRSGFNYVVASVKFDEKTLLLDASQKYNTPGLLPDLAQNWLGRLVREDGSSDWIELNSKNIAEYKTTLKIQIEDDLSIKGRVTNVFDRNYARDYREEYIGLNKETYIRNLEEDKGEIEISNIETENAEVLGKSIKETYDFTLGNGIDKIGNNIYIKPLFFLTRESNPFKSDDRTYPIFFKHPSKVSNTVYLKIPDAYEIESIPENEMFTINNDGAVYKLIVAASGKYLKIDSEFQINSILYLPEEYDTLKDFYSRMIEKNLETIVLKKV